ncbi:MAG: thiamine-phosphate kinase [Bacillota bacterium]
MEGEFELIAALAKRIEGHRDFDGVVCGIGDDTAVLGFDAVDTPRLLATVDLLAEGIHFDRRHIDGRSLGERALVVNLSDIAAMGGIPRYALVSLAIPREFPRGYLEEIYTGLADAGSRYRTAVVGGNVSSSKRGLIVDVTVMGEVARPVYRSGARPGEVIAVSGTLGASAAGLRWLSRGEGARGPSDIEEHVCRCVRAHTRPVPRLELGALLGELGATSMIDISDGLSSEVNHLAEKSIATMAIFGGAIPVDESARVLAGEMDVDPLDFALFGGEDYELLFTIPSKLWPEIAKNAERIGITISPVGRVFSGEEASAYLEVTGKLRVNPSAEPADRHWVGQVAGEWTTLRPGGWNHLRRT